VTRRLLGAHREHAGIDIAREQRASSGHKQSIIDSPEPESPCFRLADPQRGRDLSD
jgi:hypothetical protein